MKKLQLLLVLTVINLSLTVSELIESNDIERLCYPENFKNTRNACECSNSNLPPWGLRALYIDCSFKDLKSTDLSTELPLYADILDLSWNVISELPQLRSENLRQLNAMHNNISVIRITNFAQLKRIEELFLSWNSIQVIELNAFNSLQYLKVLDLSHNNLQTLPSLLFADLVALETLNLSWNRKLNETKDIATKDFYTEFGLNNLLHILNLESCSLTNITLPTTVPLQELSLRGNEFTNVPNTLPTTLTKFDISANFLTALTMADTMRVPNVQEFYIEDMPRLEAVESQALVPLVALQKISLQNSRRLKVFNAHAFGIKPTPTTFPNLRTIILRGTVLRGLNETLEPIFGHLYVLDLKGVPLYCDCDLRWMKNLYIETQGRCFQPANLRGLLISEAEKSDFSCSKWPRWLNGLIILLLIVVFSIGVYLIVMGLRPHRGGVTMRHKPGAGSPYARVTIEPNRQENQ